ncbi:loganic acid O-methyltransferase-like [Ziziphus jujuba]|uniref:Loganic acid O-methyltransferase-like n=1 Tax=Ziziphus jujuba TaxID=326968 RepID=A0A6P3ZQ01_ZIZJJ|nr:loganic acid O-methyltransferase-like [Ziziphus jujuba]
MATEESRTVQEAYPMMGGDGLYSYAKNSTQQRKATDSAKEPIKKAIAEKLGKEILQSSKTFRIADLGCSVGPNTFFAAQNILEAVESKYKSEGLNSQIPDFQVFFSDHTSNDFNLLFTSLPQDRRYYVAGVPGSFHGRLFPKNSLHFVHSSYAIHWLSRAPKEVVNKNSPAWNKGRIHYSNSGDEVVLAYKAQYDKDVQQFLQARAQEIVYGGLMVLIVPGIPNGTHHSQSLPSMNLELLGSCLMDLARKGMVSEEKVDSFNLPIYNMSPQELEAAVERNGCFSVEGVEYLPLVVPNVSGESKINGQVLASHLRAAMEGIIKQHFGEEILDLIFDSYRKKIEENSSIFNFGKAVHFFIILKRISENQLS